jgi:hypothetical protein
MIRSALIEAFRKSFSRIVFEYVGGRAAEQAMRIKAELMPAFSVSISLSATASP